MPGSNKGWRKVLLQKWQQENSAFPFLSVLLLSGEGTQQASFSELAMTAGQSISRPLLFSVGNMQWSYSVSANALITPTLTQCKKRPVCASPRTAIALLFSLFKTKGTLNTSDSYVSQRFKKKMVPRIWMLCVIIAQNVTLTCFLWLLYHQLKLWSTYLSPSKSIREKVCFCPLRCLVCNGFIVSHLQENKALGRFVSWVRVCCLLTTSLNHSACAGVWW